MAKVYNVLTSPFPNIEGIPSHLNPALPFPIKIHLTLYTVYIPTKASNQCEQGRVLQVSYAFNKLFFDRGQNVSHSDLLSIYDALPSNDVSTFKMWCLS